VNRKSIAILGGIAAWKHWWPVSLLAWEHCWQDAVFSISSEIFAATISAATQCSLPADRADLDWHWRKSSLATVAT